MFHRFKVFIRKCLQRILSPLGYILYRHDGEIKVQSFRYQPLIPSSKRRLIAGPNFMGIRGGVFNPGALQKDREIIVLARGEQIPHEDFGQHTHRAYLSSFVPLLMRFDQNLRLQGAVPLSVEQFPQNIVGRPYDPRLFWSKGRIYMSHCLHVFPKVEERYSQAITQHQYRQAVSELDLQEQKIRYLGEVEIDFPKKYHEKNWVFFEQRGDLYAIYSISPYVLLKAVKGSVLEFKTVLKKENALKPTHGWGMMRLTANPIDYDEKNLFLLVHERGVCYVIWAVLIDKETLQPVKISSRPLFTSLNARGLSSYILYPSAAVKLGDKFVFFMGEGDSHLSCVSVEKRKMDALFVPLAARTVA